MKAAVLQEVQFLSARHMYLGEDLQTAGPKWDVRSSEADDRTTRRPSQRLPGNVAGTFKSEAGTTQEYERHGSSDQEYTRELPTFASGRSQYRWQEQVDNHATAEKKKKLLSYEEHNLNNSSMDSTQQPEISNATVAEWTEAVAIAAIDADINQGTFRGRSMESEFININTLES